MAAIELLLSLGAILLAAFLFTNAVEILGSRLGLGQGAVGSILAAVGTALPETMIPIVAILGAVIVGRDPATAGEIGIGAILGAPFLLTTLAMFVVGASILGYRRRRRTGTRVDVNDAVISRDVGFFLVAFAFAALIGLLELPLAVKIVAAIILIGAYALHVVRTIQHGGGALEEVPESLIVWRASSPPPTWAVVGQFAGALLIMVAGAYYFVDAIEAASEAFGIPAGLISLILAPLATELPEKFNSVLWVKDGKDTLALGNITGAMVFQSTIPVAIGILFTPWNLGGLTLVAVVLALVSGGFIYMRLRAKQHILDRHLLLGGIPYMLFIVAAIFTVALGIG